jgi:phosphatidylglycerol:prolipoprotein diacylglycerol transferase
MHPTICQIGPFTIYSYGLMLVVAFITSLTLLTRKAKIDKVDTDIIFNLAFLAFIFGIIGARALYVVQNSSYYLKNPFEIIMLQHGGLSWFGGLIFGSISGAVYLKTKKMPVLKTFDLIAPFVVLAQAIGRIGCLLNGCCFGKVSGSGLYFKAHDALLIPTQAYSSLALVVIFIILRFMQDNPHRPGGIFFMYLALYSLKRFFIEWWRADNEIIFLGLSLFQIISLAVFLFAFSALFSIRKHQN